MTNISRKRYSGFKVVQKRENNIDHLYHNLTQGRALITYLQQEFYGRFEEDFFDCKDGGGRIAPLFPCPKCGGDLEEILFQGLFIDRCRNCCGVWLDSNTLERLITQENWS